MKREPPVSMSEQLKVIAAAEGIWAVLNMENFQNHQVGGMMLALGKWLGRQNPDASAEETEEGCAMLASMLVSAALEIGQTNRPFSAMLLTPEEMDEE